MNSPDEIYRTASSPEQSGHVWLVVFGQGVLLHRGIKEGKFGGIPLPWPI